MLIVKTVIFMLATAGLVRISRACLGNPRSHGFYRFLVWEAILVLILVNAESWFRKPFSGPQIASWVLLFGSIIPVAWGRLLLAKAGRPDASRNESHLIGLERTTRLVEAGLYRYIRHPMYASLLLLDWGVFLKKPGWTAGALALAATVLLIVTAKVEEGENVRYFGPAYRDYMRRTKMFLPGLF